MPENFATLGGIPLFGDAQNCNSGLAQLLMKQPREPHKFAHGGAIFQVAPGNPFIVCSFNGASNIETAIGTGSGFIQVGLDLLSMTGQEDLATREVSDEYIAWWSDSGKEVVAIASTATMPFRVGPVTITVKDANGNIVPPTRVIPQYNPGFRFYRLSQVSDELFDSYRNMYLAFELMLSSQFPKAPGTREIDWIENSLLAADIPLGLTGLVPVGNPSPIDWIIDTIYMKARLPLFHAKDGRVYFIPSEISQNRAEVEIALQVLTQIVLRMADIWYTTRRMSGGVNIPVFEEHFKNELVGTSFFIPKDQTTTLPDEISEEIISDGVSFLANVNDMFDGIHRINACGETDSHPLSHFGPLQYVYLVQGHQVWGGAKLEVQLTLHGIERLEVIFFSRIINASEPRSIFTR